MGETRVVAVRLFEDGDETAFQRLNEEWITKYFAMEEKDRYTLEHPREVILQKGGAIVFVTLDGEPVGCCALMKMSEGEFEVVKMAVTEGAKGLGLGRRVLAATIEQARTMGAKRLYLETNHTLTPAIHLYEALGFKRLPAQPSPYVRADVFMEMWL